MPQRKNAEEFTKKQQSNVNCRKILSKESEYSFWIKKLVLFKQEKPYNNFNKSKVIKGHESESSQFGVSFFLDIWFGEQRQLKNSRLGTTTVKEQRFRNKDNRRKVVWWQRLLWNSGSRNKITKRKKNDWHDDFNFR